MRKVHPRLRTKSKGVAGALLAGVVIVVIVVAGAGAYVFYSSSNSGTHSSTTQSTTSPVQTTSSSTTSTQSSSTKSSSTSGGHAQFAMELKPTTLLIAPGTTINYSSVSMIVISFSPNLQSVLVTATTNSSGLTASLPTSTISLQTPTSITLAITASPTVANGDYTLTLMGTAGQSNSSSKFTVRVVSALVLIHANAFNPSSLSVKAGATVYWLNLDGQGMFASGSHNITFQTGAQGNSPTLHQYDTWSFTFAQAGTVTYADTINPSTHGEVIVASG